VSKDGILAKSPLMEKIFVHGGTEENTILNLSPQAEGLKFDDTNWEKHIM
jgi:hypothetical protein